MNGQDNRMNRRMMTMKKTAVCLFAAMVLAMPSGFAGRALAGGVTVIEARSARSGSITDVCDEAYWRLRALQAEAAVAALTAEVETLEQVIAEMQGNGGSAQTSGPLSTSMLANVLQMTGIVPKEAR
jgi:hypothetical protein